MISTNHEASHYAIFCSLLLVPPSQAPKTSSAPYSPTFSEYVLFFNVTYQVSHPYKTKKHKAKLYICILCFWIRASLNYINNCPTRCNTKQSLYYSASSLYMFRVSTTPIIGSTQNCNCTGHTSLQRGQAWPRWRKVAAEKIWPVPEAVVTVLRTPDDGCGWHPKHVEWTCWIINRLLCLASRWTIITIYIYTYCNRCDFRQYAQRQNIINQIVADIPHI